MNGIDYKGIFRQADFAFAYFKVIENGTGEPPDYLILEVNPAFEVLIGLKATKILGKTLRELTPDLKKLSFDWIDIFGEVTQKGKKDKFEFFAPPVGKWYSVTAQYEGDDFFYTIFYDISDSKRDFASLKENEARLRQITENISDVIFTTDINLNTTYISPSVKKLTGDSAEDQISRNIEEKLPFDVLTSFRSALQDELEKENDPTIDKNRTEIIEKQYFRTDGSIIDISIHVQFIRDNSGNPIGLQGVIRDITDWKKSEEEQKILLQNLTKSQEIAQVGDWSWDIGEDKFYSSCEGLRIMGLPQGANPSFKDISDQIHPEDRPRVREILMNALQTGSPYQVEIRIFKKDTGEIRHIFSKAEVQLNSLGKPVKVFGVNQDITIRKKAEEKIRKSEEKFRLLIKNISDTIVVIDSNGVQQYVSPSAEKQTGYPINELQGKSIAEILHPEDLPSVLEKWQQLLANPNDVVSANYRHIHKTKGWVYLEAVGQNLLSEPSVNGVVLCVRDITERKQAEQTLFEHNLILQQAKEKAEESDRLKSVFLANISHEIRTPMNAILGFIDLLKNPNLTGEQIQSYIQIITHSGKRLLYTINDIIEISKIETGQLSTSISEIELEVLMNNCMEQYRFDCIKKGIDLKIARQIDGIKSIILSDKNKLEAILGNLINNAIKFTQFGSIEFGNYIEGSSLIFFVKDTGIGIPPDRIEAIFDRFVHADLKNTRPHEGSGLGLSIAKAYTEILNGKIWVQSDVNRGSTFMFSIPYKPVTMESTDSLIVESGLEIQADEHTVLIVDDDVYSVKLIESILANQGFRFIHANNGFEAIKYFEENPSVSLILMDIKMPGMNGLEATQRIRQINRSIPIIAQTAYALVGDKEKALEAGCTDYIPKPIDSSVLYNLIEKYIRGYKN